jgi:hypothetical protein
MQYYSGTMQYEFCQVCGEIMRKHYTIMGGHIICPRDWLTKAAQAKKEANHEIP